MSILVNVIPALVGGLSGVAAYRYAMRRVREAERLQREGWVCIGFTFIGGPVMVPRWVAGLPD